MIIVDSSTTSADENASKDGHIERSHFTNDAFNRECTLAMIPWIEGVLKSNSNKTTICDVGAGTADLTAEISNQIYASDLQDKATIIALDVDNSKLSEGKTRREMSGKNGINYVVGFGTQLPFIFQNRPGVVIQRAVTQYYTSQSEEGFNPVNPDSLPENGYTTEQEALYQYLYDTLPTGSLFIDIISTGEDKLGLERFQYMLNQITDGKRLNYLSSSISRDLAQKVGFQVMSQEMIGGDFGHRTIEDLYKRYGNGHSLGEFTQKLLGIYLESKEIYPGDTMMIEESEDDLLIKLDYCMNVLCK